MLGFLFGFNARLGRLHYFLGSIALGVVMVVLCIALGSHFLHNKSLSLAQMAWPIIGLAIIFLFSSLSLQCMRIRDIGWDPVLVMPTWIALSIVDHVVAGKFPTFAIDPLHSGTIVGALLNLGMWLALLFWPSAEYVMRPPSFDFPPQQPDPPPRRGGESPASSRVARVANGGFGRRSG